MGSQGEGGAVLRLCGVTVRYGQRVVLDLPELRVAPGEVLAIMGPNGAGKSTLLHVAALLRRPHSGEVWIAGERATRRTERTLRRRTAMVLQEPLLFDVSVVANAASGLRFRGVGRRDAEHRARLWLEQFGVGHLAARNARTLSGGEAQRVSLARAFAVEPGLLVLDEPFAALDPATRETIVPDLAVQLRETRTAAVIVTHDATEARALADRLLVLVDGRVARCERTDVVLAQGNQFQGWATSATERSDMTRPHRETTVNQ
jgi:tungstate transport system ATP-binding protein